MSPGTRGFVFNDDGSGSTRWFVLSAAVIRQVNDLQLVSCLKAVREVLRKASKTPLHFVDLKHEQRVPYIRRIGELPIRTVSVEQLATPVIEEVAGIELLAGGALPGLKPQPMMHITRPEARGEISRWWSGTTGMCPPNGSRPGRCAGTTRAHHRYRSSYSTRPFCRSLTYS